MALFALHIYLQRRRIPDSPAACGSDTGRRRHSELATGDWKRPEHADDPFQRGVADCLRQHRQPDAGPRHHAARGTGGAHGHGGRAPPCNRPDHYGERAFELHWRTCGPWRCLCRIAHDSCTGISRRTQPAHRCQSVITYSRVRLYGFAADGHLIWRGAGVAFVAYAAGRGIARRQSLDARPLIASAKGAGRFPGRAFADAAGRSYSDVEDTSQPGTPELRHRHDQPLCSSLRSGGGRIHHRSRPRTLPADRRSL